MKLPVLARFFRDETIADDRAAALPGDVEIRIVTIPPKEPVDEVYYFGGMLHDLPFDASIWDKDVIFFPQIWCPDEDEEASDDEDCVEIPGAGTVVTWLTEQGCELKCEDRALLARLTPAQQEAFRAKWL